MSAVHLAFRALAFGIIVALTSTLVWLMGTNGNWHALLTGQLHAAGYPPIRVRKIAFEEQDTTIAVHGDASSPGWTNLFGPNLDSRSPETGLNLRFGEAGPRELWRKAIGSGYSAPVVGKQDSSSDDLVLLQREQDEEVLACLDALSGEERWRCAWPTTYKCPYEYSSGPYATPVIDGDRVYAVGAQGQLHCVSREHGQVIWQRNLPEEFPGGAAGLFGFGAGLLVDGERLYLNVGAGEQQAGIVAFDKLSGETAWQATERSFAYTTPRLTTIAGQRYLLVLTDFGLAALDPASGSLLGEYEFQPRGPDVINAVTPVVQGDRVLLVAGPGPGAVCLQLVPNNKQGQMEFREIWKDRRTLDSQFNSLIHYPQTNDSALVFGFTASQQGGATFRCVELETGKLRWKHASELGRGQAIAVDGHLLLLGEHGHLQVLQAQAAQAEPVASTKEPILAGPCYSQPALCSGLLFVRNEKEVICFDLRPESLTPSLRRPIW
ncbi:PQQ-binding-like beta-propeller repeat protein [Anatilimnocola sp. NA78]|uniref:PQQ-binding-like beta-propeller repeat protein n=1 Tax=Anatilimnocola sp. NA78 TaxID=3415683 RepID=UPI003CE55F20